jgi:hypothetical protein
MSLYPNSFTTTRNARRCHAEHCFTTRRQVNSSLATLLENTDPPRFQPSACATLCENSEAPCRVSPALALAAWRQQPSQRQACALHLPADRSKPSLAHHSGETGGHRRAGSPERASFPDPALFGIPTRIPRRQSNTLAGPQFVRLYGTKSWRNSIGSLLVASTRDYHVRSRIPFIRLKTSRSG